MRRILANNLNRQLTILELISDSREWTLLKISSQLNVAEKTVKKDLMMINNIISPLKITVEDSRNYQIEWLVGYNFDYIYSCFLASSLEFQILEKILVEETLTNNELADAMFMSVSTLRRAIIRMNGVFANYQMEIITNPVRIRGNERNILKFLFNYLKEKYLVSANYLSQAEGLVVDELLQEALTKTEQSWSFTQSEVIKWVIKAHAIRLNNGNTIKKKLTLPKSTVNVIGKLASYERRLEEVYGCSVLKPIFKTALVSNVAISPASLAELSANKRQVAVKVQSLQEMIKLVEKELNIKNLDHEQLLLRVYNQMNLREGSLHLLSNTNKVFLEKLTRDKPLIINALLQAYTLQKKVFDKQDFPLFVFCLVTEWPELSALLNKKESEMVIGLFFSTTNAHLDFLRAVLQRKINQDISFINLNHLTISQLEEADVDLLVTNISTVCQRRPSLCIASYPDQEDIQKISAAYERWLNS